MILKKNKELNRLNSNYELFQKKYDVLETKLLDKLMSLLSLNQDQTELLIVKKANNAESSKVKLLLKLFL